jgi:hypothetical protein
MMSIPKNPVRVLIGLAFSVLLAGCANDPCCVARVSRTAVPVIIPSAAPAVDPAYSSPSIETEGKFLAVGYGSQGSFSHYSVGQQKLMAMRAATVDAYRNLAEQVHGFRVWGNTAVAAFATQNDSVRTYVDAFIKGARVVNSTSIGDGNYEVTVELTRTADFSECVRRTPRCSSIQNGGGAAAGLPIVISPPTLAPSMTYTSP